MNQNFEAVSLENHLFFARIMKEHAFFLKAGFLPPNADLASEGERFLREFEGILSRAITLSSFIVRQSVLDSGELFTEFTDRAECQSIRFTGTVLNRSLTARAMELRGWGDRKDACIPPALTRQVCRLNRDSLGLLDGIIRFKQTLLDRVNDCRVFTGNYPLLIEHILREARMYRSHIMALEGLEEVTPRELRDEELFWNQIMMEHALFIRGLLDPSEEKLVNTANDFAGDYKRLLEASRAANDKVAAQALTKKFRDFKRAGVTGIENCQIRSIILPLLADHVLREANHYLRLLSETCL